jgi:hypothetical protein
VEVIEGVGLPALPQDEGDERHRGDQQEERHERALVRRGGCAPRRDGPRDPAEAGNLLRRSYWPLLDRAGLPRVRFHDLRHTAATLLIERGVHPKIVSEMLGYSQISITLGPVLARVAHDASAGGTRDGCSPQSGLITAGVGPTRAFRAYVGSEAPVPVAVTVAVRPGRHTFLSERSSGSWPVVTSRFFGAPGRNRTSDTRFRKPLLFSTELRGPRAEVGGCRTRGWKSRPRSLRPSTESVAGWSMRASKQGPNVRVASSQPRAMKGAMPRVGSLVREEREAQQVGQLGGPPDAVRSAWVVGQPLGSIRWGASCGCGYAATFSSRWRPTPIAERQERDEPAA